MHLQLLSFLDSETFQVLEFHFQGRQEHPHFISSIPFLFMTWRPKEPGHQQTWYWANSFSTASTRRVKKPQRPNRSLYITSTQCTSLRQCTYLVVAVPDAPVVVLAFLKITTEKKSSTVVFKKMCTRNNFMNLSLWWLDAKRDVTP